MDSNLEIRPARPDDMNAIAKLLPRLADFEIPAHRKPEHLWHGDEKLLRSWASGNEPNCRGFVAVFADRIVGISLITLRPELLSSEPSAHLEVLTVAKSTEGMGVGRALVEACEKEALENGARTMSLNVVANNLKARGLYEHLGFREDLVRYIKTL